MPTVELDHRLVNTEVLPRFVNLSKPRVGEVDHVPDLVKWIISRLGAVSYHRGIIYNVDITIQSPVTVPRHNSGQITVPEIFLGTPDVVHLMDTLQPRSNVHTYVCTHFRDVSLGPWVAMCRAGASGCCTYGCCPDTGSIGVGVQHHGFKKSQIKKKKKVIQRRSSWRKPMDRPHKPPENPPPPPGRGGWGGKQTPPPPPRRSCHHQIWHILPGIVICRRRRH